MGVLAQGVAAHLAVPAAHRHLGDLPAEGDEALQQTGHAAQSLPGAVQVGGLAQYPLALAVVALAAGLEDGGQADGPHRGGQVVRRVHRAPGGGGDPEFGEQGLFPQPVLGHRQGLGGRIDRGVVGEPGRHLGGDVFEFEGDQVAAVRQGVQPGGVVVGALDEAGHRLGAGVRGRVEDAEAQPQGQPRQSHHAGELSAAEDADPHDGSFGRGSGLASTPAVWFSR
jgi:hypothetical protein